VILALELFVIGLVALAVAYLLVRAMNRLLPKVRAWLQAGSAWLFQAEEIIVGLMHRLLAPILFLSGLWAGVEAGARVLRRR